MFFFSGRQRQFRYTPPPIVIARQPENAVNGVLIVSPESESQGAAAGARANGLFEQVLVDRDGHAHAGYNVPVVAIGGEKGIPSEHGQECQGVGLCFGLSIENELSETQTVIMCMSTGEQFVPSCATHRMSKQV